jgi:hypothetical protein
MNITKKDLKELRKDEHGKPYKGKPKVKRTLHLHNMSTSEKKALNVQPHGSSKKHSKEDLHKAHMHMKKHGG